MNKILTEKNKHFIEQNAWMIAGNIIFAIGVNVIINPIGLYNGGFMGLSQLLRLFCLNVLHLSVPEGIDLVGIIYFLVNAPLFILGYKIVGKKFCVKSVISIAIGSLALALIPTPSSPIIHDTLAACFVGGVIAGSGAGMVMRGGSSGGGGDIIGICMSILHPNAKVGILNIAMNMFVYGICLFVFDIEVVIYSIIYSTVLAIFLDRMFIQNINVQAMVFTKNHTVTDAILTKMERGVTDWTGQGAYTKEASNILVTMISKYEIQLLLDIVHEIDPDAFIIVTEGTKVYGNFKKKLSD
jgi:uncharacterized membrane-anchored protein YitT (DUF2179 family)